MTSRDNTIVTREEARNTVKKVLYCNTDLLISKFDGIDLDYSLRNRDEFLQYANRLCTEESNDVVFISRDKTKLDQVKKTSESRGYSGFKYSLRDDAKRNMDATNRNVYVVVGNKRVDFWMAVNAKVLFICPTWLPQEDSAEYYGVCVDTPTQFFQFIETFNNHEVWYSYLRLDKYAECISLMDARTRYGNMHDGEKQMMVEFQRLLKDGESRNYYNILFYHFLANMTHSNMFDDIELFGIMPSSNCSVNSDLFTFMEQVRFIKNKRIPNTLLYGPIEQQNLLIRYRAKPTMHGGSQYGRSEIGGRNEFDSLMINPAFEQKINKLRKLERFNVLIFDDYMNFGNGFNAVRCMLESIGVNKIVFVSMGSFRQEFHFKDYEIHGSVFSSGFTYELQSQKIMYGFNVHPQAKEEIDNLYSIFNA